MPTHASGAPVSNHADCCVCARLIESAEAELSAVMWAIDASFGRRAALLAGDLWVREFETVVLDLERPASDCRRITVELIERLVAHGARPCTTRGSEAGDARWPETLTASALEGELHGRVLEGVR